MAANVINSRCLVLTIFALLGTRHIVSCQQHINEFHRVQMGQIVALGAEEDSICAKDNEDEILRWTHTQGGTGNTMIYASDGSVQTPIKYEVLPPTDMKYPLIFSVDEETTGIYTCSTDDSPSGPPDIKIGASVRFVGISGDLPDSIASGDRVTMNCARSAVDDRLIWTFGESTIYDSQTNNAVPDGYEVDVDHNDYDRPLMITSVSPSHTGSYTCTVTDSEAAQVAVGSREVVIGGSVDDAQHLKPRAGLTLLALFIWLLSLL